jgi:hypothetical protein
MLRVLAAFVILPLLVDVAGAASHEQLQELLGKDLDGARLVARRRGDVVTVDLNSLAMRTVASFSAGGGFEGLSRPSWSPDGKLIMVAHDGKAFFMQADGSRRQQILAEQPRVYDPIFWDDPKSGERCVVFKDRNAKDLYGTNRGGKTLLYRPRLAQVRKIADFPCDGGLSLDGTHLGEAFGGCLIVDVAKQEYHVLCEGREASDASMSPDNTWRLMHLASPPDHFAIRNKFDQELWRIDKPSGSEGWRYPRFSNDPNFCAAIVAPGGVPAVVRIDTKRVVTLDELGGDWEAPHLWLPSAAGVAAAERAKTENAPPRSSPIDHLELHNLEHYKRIVAAADCYTPIISDLLAMTGEPEALKIVDALEAHGNEEIEKTRKLDDAVEAIARYRKLAAQFRGHTVGDFATQLMNDPAFRKEVVAAELAQELFDLEKRLRRPPNGESHCDDREFVLRNRATIAMMSGVANSVLANFAESKAGKRAEEIVRKYRLPETIREPANVLLVADATLEKVSAMPSPDKIAPEREAVLYMLYRVDKVISGQYAEAVLSVATWGMRGGQPTPAAYWQPGLKQRLTLDLFDFHRELHRKPAADDAVNPDLVPYWINRIESPSRIWVDATGEFRIEAQLLAVKDGWVRLRYNDGREVSIPLEKLSKPDQRYVTGQER